LAILGMFLPWQQNVQGTGEVTAFTPGLRPQTVESAIPGRISNWHIREGDFVNAGDTILSLSEIKDKYFDPNLLNRLEQQVVAKTNMIEAKTNKAEALRRQIKALEEGMEVKLMQANNKLLQAKYQLISDSIDYQAEKVRNANFSNQYERNKNLYEAGNIALTKLQDIESKMQESKMKVVAAENNYLESKAELENASVNIAGVKADYLDKINKATSSLNATLSELYDTEAELSKLEIEFSNMRIRNNQYWVIAPQSGYVVRAMKAGIGETITEGEAVVSIMPSEPDKAVALYARAMDIPFVSEGRKVRVEFDGWPALQFSGWPNVSVGTFGGVVKVIDRVGTSGGRFRLMIVPDENDEPWPDAIRLGSGAKGWVMLDDVPIWYEIWRQLNGFPPSLYEKTQKPAKEKTASKE
ncbi:MAG: biotin/lipoyl-binding protein, partial [Fulvivirga sp.]|nr:biotin/lipoyl-binding protein [Fulvivirga sp.]